MARNLLDDPVRLPNAIEEMLRWWTPVQAFTRTATRDTDLSGKRIAECDVMLLLYASANRVVFEALLAHFPRVLK